MEGPVIHIQFLNHVVFLKRLSLIFLGILQITIPSLFLFQIISSALCHGDSTINDCAMFIFNYFSYVHEYHEEINAVIWTKDSSFQHVSCV